MTELPGGDNVLPLNASGAILVFTHLIAAGLQVYDAFFTLPADLAPAVKAAGRVGIDFDARRFGLRKIVNAIGQCLAENAAASNAAAKENYGTLHTP